jgi:hypothetical protein
MAEQVLKLKELAREQVPKSLRAETYFDFKAHPFAHQALFEQTKSVYDAILGINGYAAAWLEREAAARKKAGAKAVSDACPCRSTLVRGAFELIVEEGAVFEPARILGNEKGKRYAIIIAAGARLIGCDLYADAGGIFIGKGTTVEPCVGIKGPAIVGEKTEIRTGAYLRGDCILGNGCTIRGEIKNAVMMDKANFPHPSYVGDSACGYMTHFGNQATAANLGIYEGLREPDKRHNLVLRVDGKAIDLGKPKMGVCLGDFSQVGCNSVADPGTFLGPYTIAYALSRLSKGFYGPHEVLKNKPLEHGVIERSPLAPL